MNHIIVNPKGIDQVIQRIQTFLHDNIKWNDIDVYGRVYKNETKEGIIPQAYINKGEYLKDVFINDDRNASIFFIEGNKHQIGAGRRVVTEVKVVCMCNLKVLYPNINHRQDTEAQSDFFKVLQKAGGFEFKEIQKTINQCLGEFNTEFIKKLDMQPYHVFSFVGNIKYYLKPDC